MSAFFQIFEAGVKHFLDPTPLRAPQVAEIVEAFVHRREAPVKGLSQCGKPLIDRYKPLVNADETLVNSAELGVDVGQKNSDQSGVEQHRNADRQVELLVRHGMRT
jgi:hypothetical protein